MGPLFYKGSLAACSPSYNVLNCLAYYFLADLFKLFEPLIGKKSIQYANGPEGRKRRQLMDRSFSHEAVQDYYEHFVKVNILSKRIPAFTGSWPNNKSS